MAIEENSNRSEESLRNSILLNCFRLGPTQIATVLIWVGAGLQTLNFNHRSESFILGPFQLLLISGLLLQWMTIVWLAWLSLSGASHLRPKPLRFGVQCLVGIILYVSLSHYILAWNIHNQVGEFPDSHWWGFLRTSYEVLIYEVKRQSPTVLLTFIVCCLGLALLFPFLLKYLLLHRRPNYLSPRHLKSAAFTWLILACLCGGSLLAIHNHETNLRKLEIKEFTTQVDPLITMASSYLAPSDVIIEPNLDISRLTAIKSDSELYPPDRIKGTKNIIYLAVESMRADLLFKIHQNQEITPNLNALARRSHNYTNAYAQATHTDYALPSFLSSQYPVRSRGHYYYPRKATWPKTLIYDHLHHYGYKTAIISSDTTNWGDVRNFFYSPNLDTFFDAENLPTTFTAHSKNKGYITDFKATPRTEIKSLPDRDIINFDIAWLTEAFTEGRPVFLHSFFYQPHYPYKMPADIPRPFQPSTIDFESTFLYFPPEKLETMRNAYYNAVHETDAQIGRLITFLESKGALDNTIIVVTADHGEAFMEHGKVTHAGPLYNEAVHIPAIIYAPGQLQQTIDYPIQQIDFAPTVCALAQIPIHPGFQGIDVNSPKRPPLEFRDLFLHTEPPFSWRGDVILHAGRWKLWHDRYSFKYYLFDLKDDPEEHYDLYGQLPQISDPLIARLNAWRSAHLIYYAFSKYHEHYYPPNF